MNATVFVCLLTFMGGALLAVAARPPRCSPNARPWSRNSRLPASDAIFSLHWCLRLRNRSRSSVGRRRGDAHSIEVSGGRLFDW